MRTKRPDRGEAADYYFTYIDQVPAGDIGQILAEQTSEIIKLLAPVTEEQSLYRYAADKWSIRESVSHINDTERVFVARAFWFARGFDSPMPSFDQDVAAASADADARTLSSHIAEFAAIRTATLAFFGNLPKEAWSRQGIASGNPFTVRALAFMCAGHATHHAKLLAERYLASIQHV